MPYHIKSLFIRSSRLLARCLFLGLLLGLCLTGCKLGIDNTDSGGTDDDPDDPGSSTTDYIGAGSVWLLELNASNSYNLTLRDRPTSSNNSRITGKYEHLSSGYIQFEVGTAVGDNQPRINSQIAGLELKDNLLLMRSWISNELVPFVPSSECPTTNFSANWIQLVTPAGEFANNEDTAFLGDMYYTAADAELTMESRYALTKDFPKLDSTETLATGVCEEGFARQNNTHIFFADNGTALVHQNIDTNQESLWLALPEEAIASADMDGSYIGFWIDNARAGNERISNVTVECAADECTLERIGDISDLTSVAGQSINIFLDLDEGLDKPRQGFLTATIEEFLPAINEAHSGQLSCIASDDFNDSGDKLLACVGQSPTNWELTVSGIFIAKE